MVRTLELDGQRLAVLNHLGQRVGTIATSDADPEMVRFVVEYEDTNGRTLQFSQLQILHEIKAMGPETTSEVVEATHESDSVVRTHLARLTEMGLIESRATATAVDIT